MPNVRLRKAAAVIVLAGGKSVRMGRPKALLNFRGRSLIDRAVRTAECVSECVMIITSAELAEQFSSSAARLIVDDVADLGPIGGLATASRYLRTSSEIALAADDFVLVLTCDMPNFGPRAASFLISAAAGKEAAWLHDGQRDLSLPVVFRAGLLSHFETAASRRQLKLQGILSSLQGHRVHLTDLTASGVSPDCMQNLNTPAEFRLAEQADDFSQRSTR